MQKGLLSITLGLPCCVPGTLQSARGQDGANVTPLLTEELWLPLQFRRSPQPSELAALQVRGLFFATSVILGVMGLLDQQKGLVDLQGSLQSCSWLSSDCPDSWLPGTC